MIKNIKELLFMKISWKDEVPGGIMFYATVDDELCFLRMNNYPEEPLYTLIWRNFDLDLDDKPEQWSF